MSKVARILIAEEELLMPRVVKALDGYDLVPTTTFEQAQRMILVDGIDLVLVGIHFDDSRAMEVIRVVRADKRHTKTPIVMHRLAPSENAALLRLTVGGMTALNVVNEYLELDDVTFPEKRIREVVERHLPKEKLAAHGQAMEAGS